MLVTTTETIPGQNYEIIGEVFGATTQSRNVISDWGAGIKNVFGGEIKGYTKMIDRSRNHAIDRLKKNAEKLNADAVVMMRFDSSLDDQGMQSVVAYGTAVKFIN